MHQQVASLLKGSSKRDRHLHIPASLIGAIAILPLRSAAQTPSRNGLTCRHYLLGLLALAVPGSAIVLSVLLYRDYRVQRK